MSFAAAGKAREEPAEPTFVGEQAPEIATKHVPMRRREVINRLLRLRRGYASMLANKKSAVPFLPPESAGEAKAFWLFGSTGVLNLPGGELPSL